MVTADKHIWMGGTHYLRILASLDAGGLVYCTTSQRTQALGHSTGSRHRHGLDGASYLTPGKASDAVADYESQPDGSMLDGVILGSKVPVTSSAFRAWQHSMNEHHCTGCPMMTFEVKTT